MKPLANAAALIVMAIAAAVLLHIIDAKSTVDKVIGNECNCDHIIHPPENPYQITHTSGWERWVYFPDSTEIHLNKRKWEAVKGKDFP